MNFALDRAETKYYIVKSWTIVNLLSLHNPGPSLALLFLLMPKFKWLLI